MSNQFETMVKQAKLWDAFARIAPAVALVVAAVTWWLVEDALTTIVTTGIAIGITTIIVWWFWAVYSIARLAFWRRDILVISDRIQELLTENKQDLREIKEKIQNEIR